MSTYSIRADGRMVMRKAEGSIKLLGVIAILSRGRWQYRDADTRKRYGSGVEPGAFISRFWCADTAAYDPELGFTTEAESAS